MSASSMTAFVRNLFKQTDDYRSLTQRIIRDSYMQYAGVDSLDDDQRTLLREIVQILVAEMVQNEESQISNEKSEKTEDKSAKNSKQPTQSKALANKKQKETNTEEVDRPQKKRKLECSEDSASESEKTSSVKRKVFQKKVVDSSSENDGYSSTEAKGGKVNVVKKQQRMTTKKVSQKEEDSDMSGTETEDSNSESEKGKSSKTKALSRQPAKKPTKSKAVERKKKSPELSGVKSSSNKALMPKKLKRTTAKKGKPSESSEPSSDEETNPESDGSESSKPQKETEKKRAKAETGIVSRKRKLSSSSDVEPSGNKGMKSESRKMILDSDESSDGESLQQVKNKWSAASKSSGDDNGLSTQNDLVTSRKQADSSKTDVETIKKGKASSCDGSSSGDEETLADIKKKPQKPASDSDGDSDSSTIEALKKSIKPLEKRKGKKPANEKKEKKPSKTPTQVDDKDEHVKKLERIARACGVLPFGKNYKLTFEHCQNNNERSAKLKQMLRDAGMTGSISMKGAENLKLKKEAAELLSNNVIIPEGRRRNVSNPFSANSGKRRDRDSSSSPPPARENFSRLKGIVDSEEDSD